MKKILLILAGLFSMIFLLLGLVGVLQPETSVLKNINIPIEDAIKWFVLSFIAAIIPFFEEISIFGYGFKVLDKIRRTNERIDNLESIINSQKTESREYLINSFNKYVATISENERNDKLIELNRIYFKELDVCVVKVKKSLNNWIRLRNDNNIPRLKELSETINLELVNTLKAFQKEKQLKNADGIFGYYTCEKLKDYMD